VDQPSVRAKESPVTEGPQGSTEPQSGAPEEAEGVTSQTEGSDSAGTTEYGSAVERIGDVLRSAELAAEAIQAEALGKAEDIRRAALEEGERHLAQVEQEAARVREAEQRVDQMLAGAEARARATHQAADEASRREEAAREREEKLKAYIRALETTLRRALEGFRGITAQLEELLDEQPALEDETLVEALSESVRSTAGEREETSEVRPNDG
jgi:DNA repair exonuclease SbcCD ATPase subunit